MPVHQLVARLASAEGLPRVEIEECRAHWAEVSPVFMDILHRAASDDPDFELAEWDALYWIIHLMAEHQETAAFEAIIDFLREDPEWVEEELGDATTATLPGVLIRTFNGNHEALEGLIEDGQADDFLRSSAMEAWTYLVATGRLDRDYAGTYLRQCAEFRLEPRGDYCFIWDAWARAAGYLGLADLGEAVKQACRDGRIDKQEMNFADFQRMVAKGAATTNLVALLERDHIRPLTDTLAEFETWSFAREEEPEPEPPSPFLPVINPYRHVGRNDPCPCGSGKKFKKCCGGTEIAATAATSDPGTSDPGAYDPAIAPDAADWLGLDEDERLRRVEVHHRRARISLPEPTVHATLHTVVEDQIAADDPPAVRRALARLMAEGLDRHEAIHAVAWALTDQLHQVVHARTDFSSAEYEAALDDLTESRWRAATEGYEDD
jgi:uncharacterized protein